MKRTYKTILALLLSGMMIAGITACGGQAPDASSNNLQEQTPIITSTQAATTKAPDLPIVTTTAATTTVVAPSDTTIAPETTKTPETTVPPATTTQPASTTPPTTTTKAPETNAPTPSEYTYVLNTSSKKFHFEGCHSANKISEENKGYFTGSRDELIAEGYAPCGNCDP